MSDVRSPGATDCARDHGASSPRTIRTLLEQLTSSQNQSHADADADERQTLQYESREILSSLLHITPGEVSRRIDEDIDPDMAARALAVAARRASGEPLAYCLGSAAFRHLELYVDRRVLIPRPETEVVVEQALRVAALNAGGIAVDIGTGSGAIALSLATEGRFDRVIATDLSPDALDVARLNAARIIPERECTSAAPVAPVEFRSGADFEPLGGIKAHLIVSNPPYIAEDESAALPASVREWEPAMALFAPDGGMARYDALLAGAPDHLVPGGWLVLELDSRRAAETARRAERTGRFTEVQVLRDLTNRERVLLARLRGDISRD